MKKLSKILLAILAILIVLVVVVYLTAGIWVKMAVSTFVPQMTKTSASLEKADVSLFSGRLSLKGLKIANPAGFKNSNAFELAEISVKFEPKSLLTSKIIINEVKIDGTKVDAEIAKTGNLNLMILNNNIQEYLGNPVVTGKPVNLEDVEKMQQKQAEPKSGKAVLVQNLNIINSGLSFAFMGQGTKVNLPDIHAQNIGQRSVAALVGDFFTTLMANSLKAISQAGQRSVNVLLDSLSERSQEAAGLVKGLKAEMKNLF